MGIYVNPISESKDQWLAANGVRIDREEFRRFTDFEGERLPVCLVDNGAFKAAGVAYDARERDEFSRSDGRPRDYFIVKKSLLESSGGTGPLP